MKWKLKGLSFELRLSATQRSQLEKELEKASNAIKNKGGLEKAIGNIIKNPSGAVPDDFK